MPCRFEKFSQALRQSIFFSLTTEVHLEDINEFVCYGTHN